MADKKAKTALDKALERADTHVADGQIPDHTEEGLPQYKGTKEYELGDMIITPQEKQQSHVINQDDADGFDIDKKSGRFKSDKQSMSRIKNVYADGEEVVIEIDKSKTDFSIHAAVLTDQRLTPREAVQRALALNDLLRLDKVDLADRQMVQEIVEATVIAVIEARENTMRKQGATYEDIKRSRKKMLDRINEFEAAVRDKRGQAALDELTEMTLSKGVLQKVAT